MSVPTPSRATPEAPADAPDPAAGGPERRGRAPVLLGLLLLPIAGAVVFVVLVLLLSQVANDSDALAWIALTVSVLGPPIATATVGIRRGAPALVVAALTVGCAVITFVLVLAIIGASLAATSGGGSLTIA